MLSLFRSMGILRPLRGTMKSHPFFVSQNLLSSISQKHLSESDVMPMTAAQQQAAAKEFAQRWENRGKERRDSQPFWLTLLQNVYGVEHPEDFISFEDQVHLDHTSFIDGRISATKVLIEQKSLERNFVHLQMKTDAETVHCLTYKVLL